MSKKNEAVQWQPIFYSWVTFTEHHGQLGLSSSQAAMRRFLSLHSERLEAAGAIVKANGRHWLAHTARFDEAAFKAAIGRLEMAA